jgi:Ca-activated chloride channel family protein
MSATKDLFDRESRRAGAGRCSLFAAVLFLALAFPASLSADGLIVIDDPAHRIPGHFPFAPLSVSYHRVKTHITGLIASTSVDEEFYNPTDARLEGTYIFPLPEGAAIDRFSMDVNGKPLEAELLPADQARSLYESIVRKMRDPALLEYAGRGAFKVRVFPIEPRSRKRIRIGYTQLLKSDAGLIEYVYPLNTEKFSSAPLAEVSLVVTIDGEQALKSVYCPSHDAEVRRNGERRAVVGWEARDVRPDSDFRVIFSRTPSPIAIDFMANRLPGEDGYFMLLASPGVADSKTAVTPKDLCFVLDTSGSMAGEKLAQAKSALRQCLENMNEGDRFAIVRFSTESDSFFDSLVPASRENLEKAGRFIDGLRAAGGTDIDGALARALALSNAAGKTGSRPSYTIFITDGLPTVGETGEDAIVERVRRDGRGVRIFAFGVGTDVNAHLLDRISGLTRAVSQYVLPEENIELAVSGFAAKIREPVLTGLALSFSNPAIRLTGVYPAQLPDLFNGDMLVALGRYSGKGPAAAKISGSVNGKAREFTAEVSFPESRSANEFIPRLWAARRVGWLLDEVRLHGESTELRDEIIRLARQYGIVTPYTALLIVEDEERRGVAANLRSFQELEQDRAALDTAKEKIDSVRREAASEASRSGRSAVDNARAVQEMKDSWNMGQTSSGAGLAKSAPAGSSRPPASPSARLGYKEEQSRNYASQVRVLEGRAFYQNGSVWTDSTAQGRARLTQKNIRFAAPEFFALLAAHPKASHWLSLGNNIDIVVDDTLYSIREE